MFQPLMPTWDSEKKLDVQQKTQCQLSCRSSPSHPTQLSLTDLTLPWKICIRAQDSKVTPDTKPPTNNVFSNPNPPSDNPGTKGEGPSTTTTWKWTDCNNIQNRLSAYVVSQLLSGHDTTVGNTSRWIELRWAVSGRPGGDTRLSNAVKLREAWKISENPPQDNGDGSSTSLCDGFAGGGGWVVRSESVVNWRKIDGVSKWEWSYMNAW